MAIRFRGVNQINLDSKGRFAIPARYRSEIADYCEGEMVVTIDLEDPCLLLYPLPDWEVIEEQIASLPSLNAQARRMQRLLIGHATDLTLDGAGRLLLPAPLREHAGLDKKMVLLGQGRKFELWSEERWNETRDEYLDDAAGSDALPEQMQSLSL